MNLPPVANAPGSQRKLFSRCSVEQSMCVCQHMPRREVGSNRTMRDDALIPWYCNVVCVYKSTFHMLIHLLLQWFKCKCRQLPIQLLPLNMLSKFSTIIVLICWRSCHRNRSHMLWLDCMYVNKKREKEITLIFKCIEFLSPQCYCCCSTQL